MSKEIFDSKKVGEQIRNKRKQLGYTQESLAAYLGITEVYMSNVENGKHLPSNKLMKKIFEKNSAYFFIALQLYSIAGNASNFKNEVALENKSVRN